MGRKKEKLVNRITKIPTKNHKNRAIGAEEKDNFSFFFVAIDFELSPEFTGEVLLSVRLFFLSRFVGGKRDE